MPTCSHCGETTSVGAKFCPECGTALESPPARHHQARKTVTIVFSDLVDSTTLGEELDAESLRQVLDDYFEAMRTVLEGHGGVVEKFIGDAVMAVFGLPRMHEDDAMRAVRAAVGMRDALAVLNQRLSATHGVSLSCRTGVNTGVVVVGDAAGDQRLATGDAVNVAARLEQAAPSGGIVLGPDTFRLVKAFVAASSIGPLSLKGKSERIDAWQLVSLEPESPPSRAKTKLPLVGRLTELATIEARFDAATRGGRAETVLVVAEPGAGKSRLVREVVDRLDAGATVLTTACRPYGTSTFAPVTELLGGLRPGRPIVDPALLREAASKAPPEDRDAILDRVASLLGLGEAVFPLEECFWAVGRLLASLAARRPLVLLVEDLHWAEAALLDLLDHLQRFPHPAGTLLLCTARSDVLDDPHSSDAPPRMEIIRLPALSAAESDDLMNDVLGSSLLSGSARALLRRASEGNPLFLEQALTTWIEEGVLTPTVNGWTVSRPVTDVRVPASVSAIFAARLDRLPPDERLVLGAASVVGPVFDTRALLPMLQVAPAALDECLQRLTQGGLVLSATLGGSSSDDFAFEHASLRDVAYDMTLKSDRAAFHERLAEWIDSGDQSATNDGVIGHHLAEAYRYRAELRQIDSHALDLAVRSARHLVSDCQRMLRIGDKAGAEGLIGRIAELLSALGPEVGSTDLRLMEQAAKLLVTMGRWHQAVALLSPYAQLPHGPLLRDLGVALCQLHRSEPHSAAYREGQRLLEAAAAPPNADIDALASLAGTWKGVDDVRAQVCYLRCLDLDPADPYALGNVLEYEIAAAGDLSSVHDRRTQISQADRRCRSQADAGLNLPWAFYDAGKFALLLGRPYDAVASYAKAVQLTTADHMLVTSLRSLERLDALGGAIAGSTWAQGLLAVARAARFPSAASLTGLPTATPLPGIGEQSRVVMLAGGTDATADEWLEHHGGALVESFADFRGVIVSGGTHEGVAGLAGSLRERHGERITVIGYLPADVPEDATIDTRCDQLRRTVHSGFSIAEPLQAWADLVVSGVRPAAVKLLAINGGTIAGAEYRVALGLGCAVGALVGSGREADLVLEDVDWVAAPNLARLDPTTESIGRFLSIEE